MKKFTIFACLTLLTAWGLAAQQTMWVTTGQVKYAFTTSQLGKMPYATAGDTLTVLDKAFAIADITGIKVTNEQVDDNTIAVNYDGDIATVIIAGNIATKVTPTVNGADVSIVQDSTFTQEIFYTLSGTSANGSFYQDGEVKITLTLDGLNLTSTTGPAFTIDDGKRIEINLADSTENFLADAFGKQQKACMFINGHSEFKGGGTLTLTGNSKHAFSSDEYVELKKSFTGALIVNDAEGDGFNINQSLEVKNGTMLVKQCGGDGIQVDAKKDSTKNNNGKIIVSGGLIQVLQSGDEAKGMKTDSTITISGGKIELVADDVALHAKQHIVISGGNIYANSSAANGINATEKINITGGNIVAYGGNSTYGINAKTGLTISGGNLMALGAANSFPVATDTCQAAIFYLGKIPINTSLALNDSEGKNVVALTQTKSLSAVKTLGLLLSHSGIIAGNSYTLYTGSTLDTEKENWHGLYTDGDAVTDNGTAVAEGVTINAPYTLIK